MDSEVALAGRKLGRAVTRGGTHRAAITGHSYMGSAVTGRKRLDRSPWLTCEGRPSHSLRCRLSLTLSPDETS